MYLGFNAVLDTEYQGLIYKLQSVPVDGNVLIILTEFLFNRQQNVSLDGRFSLFSRVYSGGQDPGSFTYTVYKRYVVWYQ